MHKTLSTFPEGTNAPLPIPAGGMVVPIKTSEPRLHAHSRIARICICRYDWSRPSPLNSDVKVYVNACSNNEYLYQGLFRLLHYGDGYRSTRNRR